MVTLSPVHSFQLIYDTRQELVFKSKALLQCLEIQTHCKEQNLSNNLITWDLGYCYL